MLGAGCAAVKTPQGDQTAAPDNSQSSVPTVVIDNFAYAPQSITVRQGTFILFTNKDYVPHTITADDGSFDSGTLNPGSTWTGAFNTKGTFTYHCTIHPTMHGTVVVN